jgi:phosphate transport system permease protein
MAGPGEFSFKKRSANSTRIQETLIRWVLLACASISVLTTVAVVGTLFEESFAFFKVVPLAEFLFGKQWTPTLLPRHFGILPLLSGTLMIALTSSLIAIPFGLGSAVYLSEYAPRKVRRILKPLLEILAGIPSIVFGFFALTFITPLLQRFIPSTQVFNALSAGLAVGIMIIPLVASISEDAMSAVPDSMRKGAFALGATRMEVTTGIVIPAAVSGIGASFILAVSRAIGETMIVAIAAGQSPVLTANPLNSIQTMTGFMVNLSLGDIQQGTIEYKTVFAVGSMLFLMTFAMNLLARMTIRRYKEARK